MSVDRSIEQQCRASARPANFSDSVAGILANWLIMCLSSEPLCHILGDELTGLALTSGWTRNINKLKQEAFETFRIESRACFQIPSLLLGRKRNFDRSLLARCSTIRNKVILDSHRNAPKKNEALKCTPGLPTSQL